VIQFRIDERFIRQVIDSVAPFKRNVRLLELIRVESIVCCFI